MTPEKQTTRDEQLGPLDEPVGVRELADRAGYSQPQFHRKVKRDLGQTPMSARRRLLLERAAYRLTRTDESVTGIAFDAAFDSLEGFSRAFRKAFGLSPSAYRKLKPDEYRIDLSARVHFAPLPEAHRQGANQMKVPELMIEHHTWLMGQYLHEMAALSDETLDMPLPVTEPFPWCDPKVTLRQMAGSAVAYAAPWMHSINGIETPYRPSTIEEMRSALPVNLAGFRDILNAVEKDNSYDLTFVDAVCDPPMVFSYGGVIAHVLSHTTFRQYVIGQTLAALGHPGPKAKDPIDFASGNLNPS